MTTLRVIAGAVLVCLSAGQVASAGLTMQAKSSSSAKPASAGKKLPAQEVDGLLAPVALYPDQLLAQMLLSATTPARVADLDKWLKTNPPFKGTALQDAAKQTGFEPSLVMLVLFPQVVDFMATNLDWTTAVGQAFTADRAAVMESVQRLRADAMKAGKLKSSPQQSVSIMKTDSGQEVIVIEPVNPQVVYVPQYSTQAVYTQAPTSTTVVIKEESNDSAAMAAGIIGFTAGIAIGAAMDNDYYYGPYGWHGGPHMYNDDWDDFYDDRQDAREDWYEDREDVREDVRDNREDALESRSDRASIPSSSARIKSRRASRLSRRRRRRALPERRLPRGRGRRRPTAPARRATRPAARTATGRAPEPSGVAPSRMRFQITRAASRSARQATVERKAARRVAAAGAADDWPDDIDGCGADCRHGDRVVCAGPATGETVRHAGRGGGRPYRHDQGREP